MRENGQKWIRSDGVPCTADFRRWMESWGLTVRESERDGNADTCNEESTRAIMWADLNGGSIL